MNINVNCLLVFPLLQLGSLARTFIYKKEAQAFTIRISGLAQPPSLTVNPAPTMAQPLSDVFRASRNDTTVLRFALFRSYEVLVRDAIEQLTCLPQTHVVSYDCAKIQKNTEPSSDSADIFT